MRWDSAALYARELYDHTLDDGLVGSAGNVYERQNLAPCSTCKTIVNPPVSSAVPSPGPTPILSGDKSNVNYASPGLPANQNVAALVQSLSITLRGLVRDNAAPCSNHGLVNANDGSCSCDPGAFFPTLVKSSF